MATFEKRAGARGTQWRAKIRRKGQRPITKTFRRRADAERWAREEERAIDLGRSMPGSEAHHRTLSDLVDRFLAADPGTAASSARRTELLNWWKSKLGAFKLAEIRPAMIAELRDELARVGRVGKPLAVATQNRYLAALSVVMSYAVRDLEWLDSNPVKKVRRGQEPRGRVRFLDEGERERLLEACKASGDRRLYPIVLLAISSGMRQAEIWRLQWADVNLETGIAIIHETKNGQRRAAPLAGPVVDELRDLSKVRRIDDSRVFAPPTGRGLTWPETAWRVARAEADLEDFRFHDLRHTAASYLAMSGATFSEIAEILGHKTLAMVKRYAHLTEQHTVKVAQRMADKFLS